jgi:hypothetical protein
MIKYFNFYNIKNILLQSQTVFLTCPFSQIYIAPYPMWISLKNEYLFLRRNNGGFGKISD